MSFSLATESKILLKYFSKQNNANTYLDSKHIFRKIYQDIYSAHNNVQHIKPTDVKVNVNIPLNSHVVGSLIPSNIKVNVEQMSYNLSYNYILLDRPINVYFFFNDQPTKKMIKKYTNFSKLMLIWLYICINSNSVCSNALNIYIYLTKHLKKLPTHEETLDVINANTAFTAHCSSIVIFREEEWFKVFIHETMHNFNLDFSLMNDDYKSKILELFNVQSNVNLYESYVEFWARIMNCCFIAFISSKNEQIFVRNVNELIANEIQYSTFQMVKVLNYMDLTYDTLCNNDDESMEKYHENTNILAYYIIASILMNNYTDFLNLCDSTNDIIYNFKKTKKNIFLFCNFIKIYYLSEKIINNVLNMERKMSRWTSNNSSFILNNLRMTIYELK